MSIENNLKRIADSLETIAVHISNQTTPAPDNLTATEVQERLEETIPSAPQAPSSAPAEASAPAAPVPPSAPAPPTAAPAPPAPAAVPAQATAGAVLSDEDMNKALVAEFKRIGSREPIDKVMTEMKTSGVSGLTAEQQQELLVKVREIPAAS